MSIPPSKLSRSWSSRDAAASAAALEDLLRRHGIVIAPGSPLEEAILNVHGIVDDHLANDLRPSQPDYRDRHRKLVGFQEFASMLLKVADNPAFPSLVSHLRLLNTGSAFQNSRSDPRDQAANKLFELYMASVILPTAESIDLDDPFHSNGRNPDILARIDGHLWGIACKVLHGRNPQSLCDRLLDGVRQIEASPAEVGVIAISIKNILPHDELWPSVPHPDKNGGTTVGVYPDPESAFAALYSCMFQIGKELAEYAGPAVEKLFHKTRVLPGFLLWGSTPMAAMVGGRPCGLNPRTFCFNEFGTVEAGPRLIVERWQESLH